MVIAPAHALETGFYSAPYTDTLVHHVHQPDGSATTTVATFDEWASAGFPSPMTSFIDYVKYDWAPDVYAVRYFEYASSDDWYWDSVNFASWTRAGQPTVRNAGWIDGTYVFQYASSSEIFFGFPVDENLADPHKATFSEWLRAGLPSPKQLPTQGFYSYPWAPHIGYLWDTTTGEGEHLNLASWANAGYPTPQTVTHVAGEVVWKRPGSPTLYLDSAITGNGFPLSFAQWTALGRPVPVVR